MTGAARQGGADGFGKLTELDALRGIAAVIVFSGHFCEGLVPAVTRAANGTLLFTALNGPAAVIVFFVLSGFVLTLGPLRSGHWSGLVILVVKRWPRLAGPVAAAGLAYATAAIIGAFPSLGGLASGLPHDVPAYLSWGQAQHNEQLDSVLQEALVGTFLQESARHNGVLWTMHWEFLGSLLSAGLASVVLATLPSVLRVVVFGSLWVAAALYSPWLLAFPLGVLGAWLHGRFGTRLRVGGGPALGMVLCGLILLSWDIRVQDGIWAWTGSLPFALRFSSWVATESVAAGFWMAVVLYNPTVRRFLSGPLAALAGRISFAFYLIHLLVLCSLSAWLYILVMPTGPGVWAGVALYLASITATLLLAAPLMRFDQWWIGLLGRAIPGVVRRWQARRA